MVFSEQLERSVGSAFPPDIKLTGLRINENGEVLLGEGEGIAPTSEHTSFPARGRCNSLSSLLNIFTTRLCTCLMFPYSAASQTGEFPCSYSFLTGFN